jgi:hypothetical protein
VNFNWTTERYITVPFRVSHVRTSNPIKQMWWPNMKFLKCRDRENINLCLSVIRKFINDIKIVLLSAEEIPTSVFQGIQDSRQLSRPARSGQQNCVRQENVFGKDKWELHERWGILV